MEECLEQIASVLEECGRLTDSASMSEVDRVVLILKSVCSLLGTLMNSGLVDRDTADINELHTHLSQLCLEYETRLMFLLTSNPSQQASSLTYQRRGRPRKVLNLSLVSIK